jgi:hypothetical protein
MSEVLVQFDTRITGPNGSRWTPRACGRAQAGGLWEGWIEFEPANPSDRALRTSRESMQPNRDDLMYWAQGLSQTYLEGALKRAISGPPARARRTIDAAPRFNEPAAATISSSGAVAPRAVLNPFEVYQQGEDILVRQLAAIGAPHLRDIAVAYGFASREAVAGETLESLASTILAGVRNPRSVRRRRSEEDPAVSGSGE